MNICNLIRQIQKCMQICIYHIYIYHSISGPSPSTGKLILTCAWPLAGGRLFLRDRRGSIAVGNGTPWCKPRTDENGGCSWQVFVCMHACMYVYICIHIYICDYVCSLKHHLTVLFTRIQHIHTYIYIYTCIRMCVHAHDWLGAFLLK